jgi:hypothetical protein
MSTTRWERVMNQEQLMKVKIKYLEDRITTMEKSLSRINNILGRFQMTEDKQSNDPFIRVMEQGESDTFRDADTMESDHELI